MRDFEDKRFYEESVKFKVLLPALITSSVMLGPEIQKQLQF